MRTRSRFPARALLAALICLPLAATAQNADLGARLERLERALDNRGLLDLVQQVERLQQEVRQLRGELENQVYALEQVRKSQREAYLDQEQRIATLERAVPGAPGTAPGVADAAGPATPGAPVDPPLPTLSSPSGGSVAGTPADEAMAVDVQVPAPGPSAAPVQATAPAPDAAADAAALAADAASEPSALAAAAPPAAPAPSIMPSAPTADTPESEAAYREAFGMLKAGQYEQSIAAFNAFLQTYPSSQYADNAQYWLGEAYYVMRQFEPAIDQYRKLVDGYPESRKQSHALLKIAYAYHELGLNEQAVSVLNDLRNRFPGSAAARLAEERLARIRSESL